MTIIFSERRQTRHMWWVQWRHILLVDDELQAKLPDWLRLSKSGTGLLAVTDLKTDLIRGNNMNTIQECRDAPVHKDRWCNSEPLCSECLSDPIIISKPFIEETTSMPYHEIGRLSRLIPMNTTPYVTTIVCHLSCHRKIFTTSSHLVHFCLLSSMNCKLSFRTGFDLVNLAQV
jgi:hypothetical protein